MENKISDPNESKTPEQPKIEQILLDSGVLSHISDAVVVVDNEERIIYWNKAAEQLYEVTAAQVIGGKLTEAYQYRWLDPEDEQIAFEMLARSGSWRGENIHLKRNGDTIHVESSVSVIKQENGQVSGMLAVIRDISVHKQTEAALRQREADLRTLTKTLEQRVAKRTAELERRNEELDQFAYIASHDLKAPLRAIDNLASWVVEDAGQLLPDSSKVHLDKLRDRVKRMEALLNDLLLYSRIDRLSDELDTVDTAALANKVKALMSPRPGFTITVAPDMPVLPTARVPLEVVLRNLIDNAIKHHHSQKGQVHISAQDRGEVIEFRIEDDGPGIDPDFHERIFQMFQTLRPRDEIEGSGIGLAVAKKIVERKGGQIGLIPNKSQGTTFWFTWPKKGNDHAQSGNSDFTG